MKKFIIGIIVGLSIGIATNAYAAIGDSVTAVFAKFNYVVNGESKNLDASALTYEGGTYLRTTQIANMLGFDVTYKSDTRTIEFNNPNQEPTPTPAPVPPAKPAPGEPVPSGDPAPEEGATPEPDAPPAPSTEPSPEPTPSPSPPSNAASCQAIRDDYGAQIAVLGQTYNQGQIHYHTLLLEYSRDKELAAAGCQ